ncbi:MAG: UDP-glucose 4-epimerase GalE [Pseudomonadota bacterium]|nr:UDP-glucose 4-epimerase GalE [Pseudomonadota bacterium]
MRILLTGGAGFIGSHTALAVLAAGHEAILFDDFSNSSPEVVDRLSELAGRPITAVRGDVRDRDLLKSVFSSYQLDAVIHFAAKKSVAESVADPLSYHHNNVGGMLAVLEAMDAAAVRTIVFSSSATVYGNPDQLPISEEGPTRAVNPYGQTKLICENMLSDLARSDRGWRVSLLRYFNPVGAHPSGLIGEDPLGTPTNLMPILARVALGRSPRLEVFGRDYPTADGTAVRDYIHVVDLAEGHVAALEALAQGDALQVFNLGTGRGTSVRELIVAFERASGQTIPCADAARRSGDVAELYAAVDKAERELGWRATRGLTDMCADSWRFATRNNG